MNKKTLDCLFDYIDKKIEYESATTETDESGYTSSCVTERKAMELSKQNVINTL